MLHLQAFALWFAVAPAPGLVVARQVVAAAQPDKPLESGGHGPVSCRAAERPAASLSRKQVGGRTVLEIRCAQPVARGKKSTRVQVLRLELDAAATPRQRAAVDECAARFAAFEAGAAEFMAVARGSDVRCEASSDAATLARFTDASHPLLAPPPLQAPKLSKVQQTMKKVPRVELPAPTPTASLRVTTKLPAAPHPRVYAGLPVDMTLDLGFSPLSPPPHAGGLGGPMQAVGGYLVQVADRATPLPSGDPCAGFAAPAGLISATPATVVASDRVLAGAKVALRTDLPESARLFVRVVPYRHAQARPFDLQPQGERRCVVTPSQWVAVEVLPAPKKIDPVVVADRIEDVYEIKISYHPPRFRTPNVQIDYIGGEGMNHHLPDYGITMREGCAYNPIAASNRINDSRNFIEEAVLLFTQIWSGVSGWYNHIQDAIAAKVAGLVCGSNSVCNDLVGGALRGGLALGAGALGIPPELPDLRGIVEGGVDYLAAYAAAAAAPPGLAEAAVAAGVQVALKESIDAWSCPLLAAAGVCDYKPDNPYTWGMPDPFWTKRPAIAYVSIRPQNPATYAELLRTKPQRIPTLGTISLVDRAQVYEVDHQFAPVPREIPAGGIHIPFVLRPWGAARADEFPSEWIAQKFKCKDHDEFGQAEVGKHSYETAATLDLVAIAGALRPVAGLKPWTGTSFGPHGKPTPRRNKCEWPGL